MLFGLCRRDQYVRCRSHGRVAVLYDEGGRFGIVAVAVILFGCQISKTSGQERNAMLELVLQ